MLKLIPIKYLLLTVTACLLLSVWNAGAQGFLAEQRRYPRVRQAIAEKGPRLEAVLAVHGLQPGDLHILMVAYKAEKKLSVYGKAKADDSYVKIADYDICALSGRLGPKRSQGDRQVPEGFYHITHFNPASNYHLSLGIDYPNAADRIRNTPPRGGDIYIHGSCVTIGCLPMTDEGITEIYLYAVYARDSGQELIPVYIFPFEMTDAKMETYARLYPGDRELISFWENLKTGYDNFIATAAELYFNSDASGAYRFR